MFVRNTVVIALLVAAITIASWMWLRGSSARWAREEALPEITRLTEVGDLYEAYRLALEAEKLETRADIDSERLAYYGFSGGANFGPVFTAVDPRFEASVLLGGGGLAQRTVRPEMDMVNFAPRSRVPTLMINGHEDFLVLLENQLRLFRLLGAPDADKRHARLEGGHIPSDRREIIREVLDWLDRYLGPVTLVSDSATR